MKIIICTFCVTFYLLLLSCSTSPENNQPSLQPDPNNGGLTLPEGFGALVVAENPGRGRHLAIRSNGDIYLMMSKAQENGVVAALRDTTQDGKADVTAYFADQYGTGTGMEIYQDHLYFSTDTSVHRIQLGDQLVPQGEIQQIVGGFPNTSQHAAKPLAFDKQGHMYVTVGAPANACQEKMRTPESPGMDPCPLLERHGGIWQFSATELNQTQMDDGERYATGIRHAVAISWNPVIEQLYAVQHGRDQLNTLFPEHFDVEDNEQLPAEEFLLVNQGDNFGWPYCYYDGLVDQKVLAPEYGGDGEQVGRCDQYEDPIMDFPAHVAPNDLLFYTGDQFPEKYQNGAFIAFHGSWNRAPKPQEGYYVVFVPFEGDQPSGEWEIFADGFAGQEVIENASQAKFRPTGLAIGPDGSLYVADSREGKIWRIIYQGDR
ncbi:MAG: PQQ-dependent sugar dehydrogenase [Candidatus Cyclobacteriaceae bacterium M3_2C_046]